MAPGRLHIGTRGPVHRQHLLGERTRRRILARRGCLFFGEHDHPGDGHGRGQLDDGARAGASGDLLLALLTNRPFPAALGRAPSASFAVPVQVALDPVLGLGLIGVGRDGELGCEQTPRFPIQLLLGKGGRRAGGATAQALDRVTDDLG